MAQVGKPDDTVCTGAFVEWYEENKSTIEDAKHAETLWHITAKAFKAGWDAAQAADVWE